MCGRVEGVAKFQNQTAYIGVLSRNLMPLAYTASESSYRQTLKSMSSTLILFEKK